MDEFLPMPQLADPGEGCPSCGAAMAADQRYCLDCGARRGAARLDPLEHAREGAGAPVAAATGGEKVPAWAALPPAALALGRPRVAAVAAGTVLLFGALVGAAAFPQPDSASAGRIYLAGSPPAVGAAADNAAADSGSSADTTDSGSDTGGDTGTLSADTGAVPADAPAPATPSPSPGATTGDPGGSGNSGGGSGTTPPASKSPAPVKHVWVISLEGQDLSGKAAGPATATQAGLAPAQAAQAPADPFAALRQAGTTLTGYTSVTRGSLANAMVLLSGQRPTPAQQANCPKYEAVTPGTVSKTTGLAKGDGCVQDPQVVTLADRLTGAGVTWRAYAEDIGAGAPDASSCRHPDLGATDPFSAPRTGDAYLTWRNPFVYFRSITESADCGTGVVGLERLAPDVKTAADAPAFSYVIPNACHDGGATPCAAGAPAGAAAAAAWLDTLVPQIRDSKAYEDGGLIVITSTDGPRTDATGAAGVRVGAILLSQYVAGGSTIATPYDHLSLLRTLSAIFGVDAPARAAGKAVKPFGPKVFANAPAAGGD